MTWTPAGSIKGKTTKPNNKYNNTTFFLTQNKGFTQLLKYKNLHQLHISKQFSSMIREINFRRFLSLPIEFYYVMENCTHYKSFTMWNPTPYQLGPSVVPLLKWNNDSNSPSIGKEDDDYTVSGQRCCYFLPVLLLRPSRV